MKWLGILFMAVLLTGAPGYGNAQQTGGKGASPTRPQSQVEKDKPAQGGRTYTEEERKDYEKKAAVAWAEMQHKLEALKPVQEKASPQMKRTILKGLARLQRGIYAGQNQLTAMEKAPADTWGKMKVDLEKAKEAWNKEYEGFVARVN